MAVRQTWVIASLFFAGCATASPRVSQRGVEFPNGFDDQTMLTCRQPPGAAAEAVAGAFSDAGLCNWTMLGTSQPSRPVTPYRADALSAGIMAQAADRSRVDASCVRADGNHTSALIRSNLGSSDHRQLVERVQQALAAVPTSQPLAMR